MITAVIGFGTEKIQERTFYGCTALKRVVLPTPISSIGKDAFNGCSDLEEVICLARRSPECDGYVFSGVNFYNCKLMVLEDKIKVYEEAPVWQNFFNIVACDPNNIPEYKNSDNNPDVNGDGIVDTQDVLEIYKYMQEH